MSCVFHLTGRLVERGVSLWGGGLGRQCWASLRRAFPQALGACLMPDHPHIVTPLACPAEGVQRLVRTFAWVGRWAGLGRLAFEVAPAQIITGRQKTARQLRYVALNAPRKGLVADPLSHEFSTHRDVMGAIADPWVHAESVRRAVALPRAGFRERWHGYVSADPSVQVGGTPPPQPALPHSIAEVPLAAVVVAVASATRADPTAIAARGKARDIVVHLAREQGWCGTARLAALCACTPRTIQRILLRPPPAGFDAARLCLGDPRLTLSQSRQTRPPTSMTGSTQLEGRVWRRSG